MAAATTTSQPSASVTTEFSHQLPSHALSVFNEKAWTFCFDAGAEAWLTAARFVLAVAVLLVLVIIIVLIIIIVVIIFCVYRSKNR